MNLWVEVYQQYQRMFDRIRNLRKRAFFPCSDRLFLIFFGFLITLFSCKHVLAISAVIMTLKKLWYIYITVFQLCGLKMITTYVSPRQKITASALSQIASQMGSIIYQTFPPSGHFHSSLVAKSTCEDAVRGIIDLCWRKNSTPSELFSESTK